MKFLRNPWVRWLMTILLLTMLGFQLWMRSDHFSNLALISLKRTSWWLVVVLFMMPINWISEGFKWSLLLRLHVIMPFKSILKAVAGGITLSIFTPSRIGEYGGRILFMPSAAKWPVVTSTLVGSFAQNLVAFSAGVISGILLFKGVFILKISGILVIAVGCICYFRLKGLIQFFTSFKMHPKFKKLTDHLHYFDAYTPKVLLNVLAAAGFRYAIYTTQYVLILHALEPTIGLEILYPGVCAIYLIQTLVPLPPVADVMARANVGLIIWSGSGMSELSISLASLLIWLVNLLIPAVLGSFAVGTTKPENSLSEHELGKPDLHIPAPAEPTGRP